MNFIIDCYIRLGIQGILIMLVYRLGNFIYYKFRVPLVRSIFLFIYKLIYIFTRIIFSCEISPLCEIGKGIKLPHGANGVIINGKSIIGNDVTIYQQVTIGTKGRGGKAPVIGNNVFIGAGAKIIGDVEIGSDTDIGANAVVITNVPEKSIAVGVPAIIKTVKS
ncbi:serine O-acetyltransferase [Anaerococcus tetradius]|uniref:Serine acetyltransferase n=1 Tax=Anaerococcus tetradius TaxID=33036 RepID=A0A133KEQ4_9FIRM|nr:serine acetyltransferase [Anaerococcus tetradius]KWZ78059.1 serine acetyltransferase domain protein [Anaerococcus tetradius]